MADTQDICDRIAIDIAPLAVAMAGAPIVPFRAEDRAQYPGLVIPIIEVAPGRPLLGETMDLLKADAGKVTTFVDELLIKTNQYVGGKETIPEQKTPGLTISVDGNVCTLGGTIQVGDLIGVTYGVGGAGYAVQQSDTLDSIATNLAAAAVAQEIPASAVGAVVTVSNANAARFAVGTTMNEVFELWRRRKVFCADLLVPNKFQRSAFGQVIETLYAPGQTLPMPDGTTAQVLEMDSIDFDKQEVQGAYSRRVRWLIDYLAAAIVPATPIVATRLVPTIVPLTMPVGPFTPPLANQL